MVDAQYLEEKINESGKKKGYLADKLGITRAAFYNKVSGKSEFTESQATILCEELDVRTLAERRKIFCL